MAIETLYADAHITGTFSTPENAIGNTPTTWAGVLNTNQNYTSRWSLADPVSPLTSGSTQIVRVLAKKGSNSGTPTIAINLYIAGVLVASRTAQGVTSTTGQVLEVTFTVPDMSPPVDAEIELMETGQGGAGSARNSAQVAYIEWTADTTPIVPQTFVANLLAAPSAVHTALAQVGDALLVPDLLVTSATAHAPGVAVGDVMAGNVLLAAPSTVWTPDTVPGEVVVSTAAIIATATTVETPSAQVGAVTVAPPLLVAPASALSPAAQVGPISFEANHLAAAPVVYAPGGLQTVTLTVLSDPATVLAPADVMLAVDATVVVPHIYV